jgi:hypothetical protein
LPAPLNLAPVRAPSELGLNSPSDTSVSYRRPAPNPFRITSFADPYPLTPIESHLYGNHGGKSAPSKILAYFFVAHPITVILSEARDLFFSFLFFTSLPLPSQTKGNPMSAKHLTINTVNISVPAATLPHAPRR